MRPRLLLVALLALFVADKGLPLPHHHEDLHHAAQAAPAALSLPSSPGSSFAAELYLPFSPGGGSSFAIVQAHAKRLGGAGEHFLVVASNGDVFATGKNHLGQLATGTISNALTPQKVNASNVVDVATGYKHSCMLVGVTTRQVQCAGEGLNGQLGRNSTDPSSVLGPVLGALAGVSEVFCGVYTSLAISAGSGHVYAWGYNLLGGLGVGAGNESVLLPALVDLPNDFNATQVAPGNAHACFLSSAGEVRCAGQNARGQVGDAGATTVSTHTPVAVDISSQPTTKFVALSAGYDHTCAITTDYTIYCWGQNIYYQSGANAGDFHIKPALVEGITNARSLWTGYYNTYVMDNNPLGSGGAVVFGRDMYGVFGNGSLPVHGKTVTPVPFGQGMVGIVEIRGGFKATCLLDQLGEVWCTGRGQFGQFGKGGCVTSSLTLVHWGTPCNTSQPTLSPTSSQAPTTTAPTSAADTTAMASGALVSAVLVAAAVVF